MATVQVIENSEYSLSGRDERYGTLISESGRIPKAGNPSKP